MSTFVSRIALALALFALVGCATTTFISTWKAPDARPVGPLTGKKVIAFVLIRKAPASRREAEDALARQISLNGRPPCSNLTLQSCRQARPLDKASGAGFHRSIGPVQARIPASPPERHGRPSGSLER